MWYKERNTGSRFNRIVTVRIFFINSKLGPQILTHRQGILTSFLSDFSHYIHIFVLATAWMDLESIMLSEICQSEKDKYHMISLTCGIWRTKLTNKQIVEWHDVQQLPICRVSTVTLLYFKWNLIVNLSLVIRYLRVSKLKVNQFNKYSFRNS